MTLLLIVMLVHFQLLHTDDPRFLVAAGARGFLVSYALLPAVGLLAVAHLSHGRRSALVAQVLPSRTQSDQAAAFAGAPLGLSAD